MPASSMEKQLSNAAPYEQNLLRMHNCVLEDSLENDMVVQGRHGQKIQWKRIRART